MTKHIVAASLIALGAAGTLAAQATTADNGDWRVVPSVGLIRFDRTSALSSTSSGLSKMWPMVGIDAMYKLRSNVRVGIYLGGARVTTSPDYFPLVLFKEGGSQYELWSVSQRVTVFNYGVQAAIDVPLVPSLSPFVRVGVGGHSVYQDAQKANSIGTVNGAEFELGGGIRYNLKSGVGLRLDVTDFMWSNWDRDVLNPVTSDFQNTVFPKDNPAGVNWAKPSLNQNLRLAIGFAFTPAVGGGTQ